MSTQTSTSNASLESTRQCPHLHARLKHACEGISYRELGRLTGTHAETVRRYMQGQTPSASFLSNLSKSLGISGEWLLSGRGPMKCSQIQSYALSHADTTELMTAVAHAISAMNDRIDLLDQSVSRMEQSQLEGGLDPADGGQTRAQATKLSLRTETLTEDDTLQESLEGEYGEGEQSNQSVEPKPCAGSTPPESSERISGKSTTERIRNAIAKRPA